MGAVVDFLKSATASDPESVAEAVLATEETRRFDSLEWAEEVLIATEPYWAAAWVPALTFAMEQRHQPTPLTPGKCRCRRETATGSDKVAGQGYDASC